MYGHCFLCFFKAFLSTYRAEGPIQLQWCNLWIWISPWYEAFFHILKLFHGLPQYAVVVFFIDIDVCQFLQQLWIFYDDWHLLSHLHWCPLTKFFIKVFVQFLSNCINKQHSFLMVENEELVQQFSVHWPLSKSNWLSKVHMLASKACPSSILANFINTSSFNAFSSSISPSNYLMRLWRPLILSSNPCILHLLEQWCLPNSLYSAYKSLYNQS